ncbi:oxidoreductase (thioredoxin-disulfide reductase-like protein) [Natrialba chahannaoensis JCM 10990]|uniref:Oxidoreductase (Thioredoxin-disulfide reductase-like protein) n=1 Tax=Natrialba chahannaoensis JCM 10990 TaxID=1227492 RepID=M0ADQ9_9EURY|nr:FAD-dependent oxidoreductase [Natrialba chahannaoensis]ELY96516.1 oxidoreductase (thioredoxin-disulfide reductase-like protein) [Natrialba chahannaoensis JCM 10990]
MTDAVDSECDAVDETDRDVVVVGGGPTGAAAAIFTARHGLDTVVFDRGNAALRRCAYLENYPGFPGGIDIEGFYDLLHAHVETAGGDLVPDLVESVDREHSDGPLVVETQEGRRITAGAVVAAAWYDGSYLRPLGGDELFETHDHDGEEHDHFDSSYPGSDGRTPIDGLYVASPNGRRNAQAIIAAGQGAHVARSLIEDHRTAQGFPDGVAERYDWLRRDSAFTGEWATRERWREWYDEKAGDDHDLETERYEELRVQYIDRAFETRLSESAAESRAEQGLRELVEAVGTERVLDAVDDQTIRSYFADAEEETETETETETQTDTETV